MFLPFLTIQDCVIFPSEKKGLKFLTSNGITELIKEKEVGSILGLCPCDHSILGFGTEVKMIHSQVLEDGTIHLAVEGLRTFKIENFIYPLPDKTYPGGDVVFLERFGDPSDENLIFLSSQLNRLLKLSGLEFEIPPFNDQNSFKWAEMVQLSFLEKLELIKLETENDRIFLLGQQLKAKVDLFTKKINMHQIDLKSKIASAKKIDPSIN